MNIRNLTLILFATLVLLPSQASAQSSRKVKAKFTWDIGNTENTKSLTLRIMIPVTIEGRQKVTSVRFSAKPDRDQIDETGSRYAVFQFGSNIPKEIVMEVDLILFKAGLGSSGKKKVAQPDAKYLGSDDYIQTSDPQIKALAKSLRGSNEAATIKNIMTYLTTNLTYDKGVRYVRQGNVLTLEKKTGICGDYSDLMIALCRANGIPARLSGGYLFNRDFIPGWDGDMWHAWVDVFMQGYGWVPFEPTRNEMNGWQAMLPQYIYVAQDLMNSHANATFNYSYNGWRPRVDSFVNIK